MQLKRDFQGCLKRRWYHFIKNGIILLSPSHIPAATNKNIKKKDFLRLLEIFEIVTTLFAFKVNNFYYGFFKVFPRDPAGIYLLKVNNRNTRTRCEIFSKLTTKTLEQSHRCFYC